MAHINRLYDFQPGTKIVSGQVDAELNQLVEKSNELDDNFTNLDASSVSVNEEANLQELLNILVRFKSNNIKYVRLNVDNVIESSSDGLVWEATGSSGHLILDGSGNILAQRSRLQFANTIITDVPGDNKTVVSGVVGPAGPIGPVGQQGVPGVQGETGKSIIPSVDQQTGLMSFYEGPAGIIPSTVNVRGPQGVPGVQGQAGPAGPQGTQGIQGPGGAQGPVGPQGATGAAGRDGTSFEPLGLYTTLLALQTAHPVGNPGDAYFVGTSTNNVIYNWDVDTSSWVNVGPLQGPVGPQGIQGIQGPEGPQGPEGAQGPPGATGDTGAKGDTGAAGPNSISTSTDSSIVGLIKGSGGKAAAATGGTDFQVPTQSLTNEDAIDDADHVPYYDASVAEHRKVLFSKIKEKLETYFNNIYSKFSGVYADLANIPSTFTPSAHAASHKTGGIDALTPGDIGAETSGAADTAVSTHNSAAGQHSAQFNTKMNLSGDTFTGQAIGQSNTSYSTAQLRNAIISTTDLTAGSSSLASGALYFVYE